MDDYNVSVNGVDAYRFRFYNHSQVSIRNRLKIPTIKIRGLLIMSMYDPEYFSNQIKTKSSVYQNIINTDKYSKEQREYWADYLADVLKIVLQEAVTKYGENKIASILSVGTPLFQAVVDYTVDGFYCPVDHNDSIHDFLNGLADHIQERLREDYYNHAELYLPHQVNNALIELLAIL